MHAFEIHLTIRDVLVETFCIFKVHCQGFVFQIKKKFFFFELPFLRLKERRNTFRLFGEGRGEVEGKRGISVIQMCPIWAHFGIR